MKFWLFVTAISAAPVKEDTASALLSLSAGNSIESDVDSSLLAARILSNIAAKGINRIVEPSLKRQKIVHVVSLGPSSVDQENDEGENEKKKEVISMAEILTMSWDAWDSKLRESDLAYRGIDERSKFHCDTIAVIGKEIDYQLTITGRLADEIIAGLIRIMNSIHTKPTIFGLVVGIRKVNGAKDIALEAMSIDISVELLRVRSLRYTGRS
jgi:hypothetical protein